RSHLELLNIQMPRRLWQASCTHSFGDQMCQFDRSSMRATVVAGPGSSQSQIAASVSATPSSLYTQGTIVGVTGANAGASRTVSNIAIALIFVKLPFLYPFPLVDHSHLLTRCDATFVTGANFFNNAAHSGGFQYIQTPETAI